MKSTWLLIFGLVTMVPVAGQNNPKNNNEQTYNTLYSNFTTPMLSQPELAAFNARAQQKAQDMFNYILLINNPQIGRQIREHAILQCRGLFRENANFKIENNIIGVEQFLKGLLNQEREIDTAQTLTTTLLQPLRPRNDGGYEGEISLLLSDKLSNSKYKKQPSPVIKWNVKFYLLKIPKEFGDETIELWEVIFGDISIAPN